MAGPLLRHALALVGAGLFCAGCEAIAGYSDQPEMLAAPTDGGPCAPGEILCDGGVCANPASDEKNCGGCGRSCGSNQTCVSGACACAAPSTVCGSSCVDLMTDKANCASCGHRCGFLQHCGAGKCSY